MGKRLMGLLRGSIAALRGARHPHVFADSFRWLRSARLALKPLATAPELCKRGWKAVRELSGDNGYERYLEHHAVAHPDTSPLSREAWFANRQQHKWAGVKRCC